MGYLPDKTDGKTIDKPEKRHYHDWYNYETRKTTPFEAFWMTVISVVLVAGLPLGFAALFHYGVPFLAKIW